MKKWIKHSLRITSFIAGTLVTIFSILISTQQMSIYWIILPILIGIIYFISGFLPIYSTNKYLICFYNYNFIGKYNGVLEYKTFDDDNSKIIKSEKDSNHVVEFAISIDDDVICKTQKTKGKNIESKSKLESFYSKKDTIIMYFHYTCNDNNYEETYNKNEHSGVECIKYNIKTKILSIEYFNYKPGCGKIINIEKIQ